MGLFFHCSSCVLIRLLKLFTKEATVVATAHSSLFTVYTIWLSFSFYSQWFNSLYIQNETLFCKAFWGENSIKKLSNIWYSQKAFENSTTLICVLCSLKTASDRRFCLQESWWWLLSLALRWREAIARLETTAAIATENQSGIFHWEIYEWASK